MINTATLKKLKEDLDIINVDLTELLKVRSEQKLFKNSDDYYNALYACKFFPENYYFARLFDSEITLRFNNRIHKFYVHLEHNNMQSFFRYNNLLEYCKINNIKIDSDFNKFVIPNELYFENVVKIYYSIIKIFIEFKLSEEKLFYTGIL